MRAEDSNFESIMEGNDSIFATNLQESLVTPLTNLETAAEKSSQPVRIKPSNDRPQIIIRMKVNYSHSKVSCFF